MGELSVVLKQYSARCRLQWWLLQDATHPGPLPLLPPRGCTQTEPRPGHVKEIKPPAPELPPPADVLYNAMQCDD